MSKKKKILIILGVVLVVGAVGAKTFLLGHASAKQRIAGSIYILPKQFTLNLADKHYATLTVALILAPGASAAAAGGEGAPPPDGFGTLPEEAAIRDIITSVVTDQNPDELVSSSGREGLKQQILRAIDKSTDVKATGILFTDVAVQ